MAEEGSNLQLHMAEEGMSLWNVFSQISTVGLKPVPGELCGSLLPQGCEGHSGETQRGLSTLGHCTHPSSQ